jgi:hypothetical protein
MLLIPACYRGLGGIDRSVTGERQGNSPVACKTLLEQDG